jgi:hypothetical protein
MEKLIIALKGKANVGKSHTIKLVSDFLLSNYKNLKIVSKIPSNIDISIIIDISGIKIGIESQGDPGGRLSESLIQFLEMNCDIIICATRTRGQTVNAVNKLNSSHNIIWLNQVIETNITEQKNSNIKMAQIILSKIDNIIGD